MRLYCILYRRKLLYLSIYSYPAHARIKLIRSSTKIPNKSGIELNTEIGGDYTGRSKEFETNL
jgi:hypothetical protein